MSEKIYAWLLRLYPSSFQAAYREEALQLIRDRARDERGFSSSLRLWFDLLSDLAISIPRSYRAVSPVAIGQYYCGIPLFLSLEREALSPVSLVFGVIGSCLLYSIVLVLLGHTGTPLSVHVSDLRQSASYSGQAAAPTAVSPADLPQSSGATAKPVPGVSLSYLPLPPASGSVVRFTVRVIAADGASVPTGDIRLFDGTVLLTAGKLENGTVAVTGQLPNLPKHVLYAVYSGDDRYSSAFSSGGGNSTDPAQPASPSAMSAVELDAKPLGFEVVSIHEDKSGAGPQNVTMGATPDGFRARNVPLLSIIQGAYRPTEGGLSFRPNRIIGLPPWAFSQLRYDIDAKVAESDLPMWRNPALQPEMLRTMMQTMLADRCKLVVHRENKAVPVYELTVGRRGPKLAPYTGATLAEIQRRHPGAHMLTDNVIVASGPNPGEQSFFGVTMSQLGTLLSNMAGRPVLDKTGLTGRYDVSYQIELRPPPQADGTPAPVSPDFFSSQISTIVEDQLGLKLKAGTEPVESLVIEHIERPSEN